MISGRFGKTYENMPDWFVRKFQSPGVPRICSSSLKTFRRRLSSVAIAFKSLAHILRIALSLRIISTILAPNEGLEPVSERARSVICFCILPLTSWLGATTLKIPTRSPYRLNDFAKVPAKSSGMPASAKTWMLCASDSGFPEIRPKYAVSKKAKCWRVRNTWARSCHWSRLGSHPVRLFAELWTSTTERDGRFSIALFRPSQSRHFWEGS